MDRQIKTIIFDLVAATDIFVAQKSYYCNPTGPDGRPDDVNAFLLRLSPQESFDLLLAHAKEICEQVLSSRVRDSSLLTPLEFHLCDHYGLNYNDDRAFIDVFIDRYIALFGDRWAVQLMEHICTGEYGIWEAEVSQAQELVLTYQGDYRILEWEREHMRGGKYHANPIRR